MSHHGWVSVLDAASSKALQSPFGRLVPPARGHSYNSLAISLLAGALGPLQGDSVLHSTTKPAIPAGFTFFGQFIDHDLTEFRVLDPSLRFVAANPIIENAQRVLEDGGELTCTNGRTGRLDLDSVYGLLGRPDLALFDDVGRFRMRELVGRGVDIQRNVDYRDGRLISDPRNDENKIIVQIHVLFQRLHDALHVDAATTDEETVRAAINATRERVTAVYHRIVFFDYLPRVADPAVVVQVGQRVAAGTSLYQQMNRRARTALEPLSDQLVDGNGAPGTATPVLDPVERAALLQHVVAMPVEFAHAAFRLGHSQLRDGYQLNDLTGLPLFRTALNGATPADPRDLRGNARIDDDLVIAWAHFFGSAAQPGEPLDPSLPASVFRLPPPAIDSPPVSLAERNIRRGIDFGLPSGQEVARAFDGVYGGVGVLSADQVLPMALLVQYPELGRLDPALAVTTPLWYYVLIESSTAAPDHSFLGPAGSYLLAETLVGSIASTAGVDLAELATDYLQKIVDVQTAAAGDEDDINTMAHLLAFLGEPGF